VPLLQDTESFDHFYAIAKTSVPEVFRRPCSFRLPKTKSWCASAAARGDRKGYDAGKLGDLAAACAGEQEKADDVAERASAVGGVPDGDDFVVGECARLAGLAATSSTTPNGTSGSFEAASRCPIVHLLRISLTTSGFWGGEMR